MKVGVCEAQQLKERGEKLGLTLRILFWVI